MFPDSSVTTQRYCLPFIASRTATLILSGALPFAVLFVHVFPPSLLICHWYFNPSPVAFIAKFTTSPAFAFTSCGCSTICNSTTGVVCSGVVGSGVVGSGVVGSGVVGSGVVGSGVVGSGVVGSGVVGSGVVTSSVVGSGVVSVEAVVNKSAHGLSFISPSMYPSPAAP